MPSQNRCKVGSTQVTSRVEPGYIGANRVKIAARGHIRTDDEIAALLVIWSDDNIQRQLRGAVRNTVPFRTIAQKLERQQFSCDFKQCHEKIKC